MTTKYLIQRTTKFKKSYKKLIQKQGYHEDDFRKVIEMLANDIVLPKQYRNHLLEPKSNRFMGMSYQTRLVTYIQEKQTISYFSSN